MRGPRQGDFTRLTFDAARRYRAVWMQQGRPQLDADWNAQVEIAERELAQRARDLIGRDGGPEYGAGFGVTVLAGLRFDHPGQFARLSGEIFPLALDEPFAIELRFEAEENAAGVVLHVTDLGHHAGADPVLLLAVETGANGGLRLSGEALTAAPVDAAWAVAPNRIHRLIVEGDGGSLRIAIEDKTVLVPLAVAKVAARPTLYLGAGAGATHAAAFRGHLYELLLRRIGPGGSETTDRWLFHRVPEPDTGAEESVLHLGNGSGGGAPRPALRELMIAPGRYYVDGIACELGEAERFTAQADLPGAALPTRRDADEWLIYLDASERTATAIQDPAIREIALGGGDTTVRSRIVTQVRALPVIAARDETPDLAWDRFLAREANRGTLRARRDPNNADYLSNLLYRVEIHSAGYAYEPNPGHEGRVALRLDAHDTTGQTLAADAADWRSEVTHWSPGDVLLLLEQDARKDDRQPLAWAKVANVDRAAHRLTLDRALEVPASGRVHLRRLATFKWSRANGSVAMPIAPVAAGATTLVAGPSMLGTNDLRPGDWVEILDDRLFVLGASGPLCQTEMTDGDRGTVSLRQPVPAGVAESAAAHPFLRRWDQRATVHPLIDGAVPVVAGAWQALEGGIEVRFDGDAPYRAGDYWSLPARAPTQDIEWPHDAEGPHAQPPLGPAHLHARLATLSLGTHSISVRDERRLFTSPTSETIRVRDGRIGGNLAVDGSLGVGEQLHAKAVRADHLSGVLESPASVGTDALADRSVTRRKLAPDLGTLPIGGMILTDSPHPPPGFRHVGSIAGVHAPREEWHVLERFALAFEGPLQAVSTGEAIFLLVGDRHLLEFDPTSSACSEQPHLPEPVRDFAMAGFDGRLVVSGGVRGSGEITDAVWMFDIPARDWIAGRPLPRPTFRHASAAIERGVVILGGRERRFGGWHASHHVALLDAAIGDWIDLPSLRHGRYDLAAAGSGNRLYAIGGRHDTIWRRGILSRMVEVFRLGGDDWRAVEPLDAAPPGRPGAAELDGRIHVVDETEGCLRIYDPHEGGWMRGGTLPGEMTKPVIAAADGRMFAFELVGGAPAELLVAAGPPPHSAHLHAWIGREPEAEER